MIDRYYPEIMKKIWSEKNYYEKWKEVEAAVLELKSVEKALIVQIRKYKNLVMCGRTHGQVAEPITLGLKLARHLEALKRDMERLKESKKRIFSGKISGAVGTYSLTTPVTEKKVLKKLGLNPLNVTSHVLPRDIFAEYLFILALICAFAEETAQEIRLLTQDGIKEISEPFLSRQ